MTGNSASEKDAIIRQDLRRGVLDHEPNLFSRRGTKM
jgi:hypothetical protein